MFLSVPLEHYPQSLYHERTVRKTSLGKPLHGILSCGCATVGTTHNLPTTLSKPLFGNFHDFKLKLDAKVAQLAISLLAGRTADCDEWLARTSKGDCVLVIICRLDSCLDILRRWLDILGAAFKVPNSGAAPGFSFPDGRAVSYY